MYPAYSMYYLTYHQFHEFSNSEFYLFAIDLSIHLFGSVIWPCIVYAQNEKLRKYLWKNVSNIVFKSNS